MSANWTRWLVVLGVAIAGAGGLGGCQDQGAAQQTEALKTENGELRERLATSEAEKEALAARLRDDRSARGPGTPEKPVKPITDEPVIELAGDVLFASGSDQITVAGKRELDKVASTIRSRWPGKGIRIEGYTDSDPIKKSPWGSNEALSLARAQAVEKYLSSKGFSSSRIEAVGMGAAKPRATKAASRRVEIHITSGTGIAQPL